jgi:hypothetical protein
MMSLSFFRSLLIHIEDQAFRLFAVLGVEQLDE